MWTYQTSAGASDVCGVIGEADPCEEEGGGDSGDELEHDFLLRNGDHRESSEPPGRMASAVLVWASISAVVNPCGFGRAGCADHALASGRIQGSLVSDQVRGEEVLDHFGNVGAWVVP